MIRFNFGKNWMDYSQNALSEGGLQQAEKSLKELLGEKNIKDKSFLDIGCGSGIFSIAAKNLGASKVVGFDISDNSIEVSKNNVQKFHTENIEFYQADILDSNQNFGKFDIVYAWGVLHHTGNMQQAIINTTKLVNSNGILVISIYNKHWTSPLWKRIKYFYNVAPNFIKKIMVFAFYWIIVVAKFLISFKNPFRKKRGMNFYYDVIDWLGGYPYEYATKEEVINFVERGDFKLLKFVKASVPTGCNEFVFQKL